MSDIHQIFADILKRIPEIKGLILQDAEGGLLDIAGQFDIKAENLGSLLAASYQAYAHVAVELGQSLEMVTVEFKDLKLSQSALPHGLLTVISTKECFLGVVRLEAKKAGERISQLMKVLPAPARTAAEERPAPPSEVKETVEDPKLRLPKDKEIEMVLAKLREGLK